MDCRVLHSRVYYVKKQWKNLIFSGEHISEMYGSEVHHLIYPLPDRPKSKNII